MFNRSVSYKSLLRIAGILFLFYGGYLIARALTAQIVVSGDMEYSGPIIFVFPGEVWTYIFYGGWLDGNAILPSLHLFDSFLLPFFQPGPLLYVGIGIFLLGLASMGVKVAYWCFQVTLWFICLSFWFPVWFLLGYHSVAPDVFTPFFLVTLVLSLALLVLYKPVTHLLRKLFGLNGTTFVAGS
jgi:hypothetical protein